MKSVQASEEDLAKYRGILDERPMSHKKIKGWWKEMIQKYSLDLEHEWSVNFNQHKFIGEDKKQYPF